VLRDAVDERFEFVRYAESLAGSQPTFDPLAAGPGRAPQPGGRDAAALTLAAIEKHQPTVVLLSVPFPGSVYAAFRIAQAIKAQHPHITTVLGGGFVNTELRELAEPRVFDYFDFVTLDAGERPLLALLEHLQGQRGRQRLVRTLCAKRVDGAVQYINMAEPDVPFAEVGTPTWDGLPLDRYLSLLDMLNPMHRLWSDGRWNKLTVAHGCYWKKCSFCDVSLDYISRYETRQRHRAGGPHRGHRGRNRADRLSFCGRSRAAQGAEGAGAELIARHRHQLVGQHPFEKTFSPELCRAAGRQRLHCHQRRAGSGV
jgi:hypothetical protein